MNNQDKENLSQLFEKFVNSEQADRAAEDIQRTEQIISKYPAPEPDEELLAEIKTKVAVRLEQRKAGSFRKTVYKAVSAAAAVIILASVSVRLFQKDTGKVEVSTIPKTLWESGRLAEDDYDLASLTAEFEDIESEMLAVHTGTTNGNGNMAELEIELTEIDSDFWKG